MSAPHPHIILDCLPSLCQKLSDLVEVWGSYNENNFACFFEPRCIVSVMTSLSWELDGLESRDVPLTSLGLIRSYLGLGQSLEDVGLVSDWKLNFRSLALRTRFTRFSFHCYQKLGRLSSCSTDVLVARPTVTIRYNKPNKEEFNMDWKTECGCLIWQTEPNYHKQKKCKKIRN